MKYFGLVWSNLGRKKLRTALTVLSIFIAFLLFGLLCALKQALVGGADIAGADRLVVRHRVSIIQLLPAAYKDRMLKIPGVTGAVHQTWFGGMYGDAKQQVFSFPVEPEDFLKMFPEFVLPADQLAAWKLKRTGAVVGRTTAKRLGFKVGDRVPLKSFWPKIGGGAWEFDIVGIFDGATRSTDTSGFMFRYDYFDEARVSPKGQVGWYTVKVADPSKAAEVAKRIDEEFANSSYETKAEPEGAFAQAFASQVGDVGKIMVAVLSAVFFTILLIAGNTMGQAIRERTEELGVLKAMGFKDGLVLGLVLAESVLICLVGGLAGLGVAALLIAGGGSASAVLPRMFLPERDLAVGLVLVVALGVVTGLLPAIQAGRLTVAEALRRGG
jgi:putative ABC transport system permease protein